ncbi:hypothetical protein NMG60_11020276 [Bertholletia excelsa]
MAPATKVLVLLLFTWALSMGAASSQSVVKTLPGYPGDLPFKLETGYVSVGEMEDVHLFYYFIESEGNPREDPLLLWLTGGPGCSAFSGLVYEIGPLNFDTQHFDGKFPKFILNPYSWTKVSNIIFLDAPVGTGFSYADNWPGYVLDDLLAATEVYHFLMKWLIDHPKFLLNELYIAGDSYSGLIVPNVVQKIYQGNNKVGVQPLTRLKGYILGNPVTNEHDDPNSRVKYAHRVALLSDGLYESTKNNCQGEYIDVDPSNAACIRDLDIVNGCIKNIYLAQILEPNCAAASPNSTKLKWDRRFFQDSPTSFLLPPLPAARKLWCRSYNYVLSDIWANDGLVEEALHVRKGTKEKWVRCNKTLSYAEDLLTSFYYHKNLSHTDLRALIYSGDHDMGVPYVATHEWIEALELPVDDDWRPWFVNGQIAGYTMKYVKKGYHLTFATVKGGGHTAPEYRPEECLAMLQRWLAYYAL